MPYLVRSVESNSPMYLYETHAGDVGWTPFRYEAKPFDLLGEALSVGWTNEGVPVLQADSHEAP